MKIQSKRKALGSKLADEPSDSIPVAFALCFQGMDDKKKTLHADMRHPFQSMVIVCTPLKNCINYYLQFTTDWPVDRAFK